MKVCVVGAGAVGGMLAVRLALAGNEVSVVDIGAHLGAIRENGLRLIWSDGTTQLARPKACASLPEAGRQDLIILAVKSNVLEEVAAGGGFPVEPDTMVMTVQNGIPWWYFQREGGPFDGHTLRCLDGSGTLERSIDAWNILGCVAYTAAEIAEPGVIRHIEGDRFPFGELDGAETERAAAVHRALTGAGLKSRILKDIRSEIWLKAWGTLSFNPISALTHATLVEICRFDQTRNLATTMMEEAKLIAEKLGIVFRHTIKERIRGAEAVGSHKTSMLQDVEAGRPLELAALMGAILEIASLTGSAAPSIQAIYSCVKLLDDQIVGKGVGVRLAEPAECPVKSA